MHKQATTTSTSRLSLTTYIRWRTGLPLGAKGSLSAMLKRAFGATSLAGFWRYWNPIFGYGLARYIEAPLRGIVPRWLALMLTFIVCGAIHDAVTMLVRGSGASLFTLWFGIISLGIVVSEQIKLNFNNLTWRWRAVWHLSFLGLCLLLTLTIQAVFGLP